MLGIDFFQSSLTNLHEPHYLVFTQILRYKVITDELSCHDTLVNLSSMLYSTTAINNIKMRGKFMLHKVGMKMSFFFQPENGRRNPEALVIRTYQHNFSTQEFKNYFPLNHDSPPKLPLLSWLFPMTNKHTMYFVFLTT